MESWVLQKCGRDLRIAAGGTGALNPGAGAERGGGAAPVPRRVGRKMKRLMCGGVSGARGLRQLYGNELAARQERVLPRADSLQSARGAWSSCAAPSDEAVDEHSGDA